MKYSYVNTYKIGTITSCDIILNVSLDQPVWLLVGVGRLRGANVVCTGTDTFDMTALLFGRCLGATDVPSFVSSDLEGLTEN